MSTSSFTRLIRSVLTRVLGIKVICDTLTISNYMYRERLRKVNESSIFKGSDQLIRLQSIIKTCHKVVVPLKGPHWNGRVCLRVV